MTAGQVTAISALGSPAFLERLTSQLARRGYPLDTCMDLAKEWNAALPDSWDAGLVEQIVRGQFCFTEEGSPRGPRVLSLPDFLAEAFPPPEPILEPWLASRDIAMIYAWRGVGKSFVGLGIAYAIATGGRFLRWSAPKPRRVLLVDGENDPALIQQRLADMASREPRDGAENLRILARLAQSDLRIALSIDSPPGQANIEAALDGVEVVILDNVSSLSSGTRRENDVESWGIVQDWLVRLRGLGKTVIFFHHSGKDGKTQRGTSGREDVLNTVLLLEHPSDYEFEQGARFDVVFEKSRSLLGLDVRPFEAWLRKGDDGFDTWQTKAASEHLREEALDLMRAGKPDAAIGRMLGVDRSTVWRWRRSAKKRGEL